MGQRAGGEGGRATAGDSSRATGEEAARANEGRRTRAPPDNIVNGYTHRCRRKGCGHLRAPRPKITSEVYGHLDLEDLREGLNGCTSHPR